MSSGQADQLGPDARTLFARSMENHGFARDDTMTVDDSRWTLSAEHERASYRFSEGGSTQEIS
jgi:hypothetical protein